MGLLDPPPFCRPFLFNDDFFPLPSPFPREPVRLFFLLHDRVTTARRMDRVWRFAYTGFFCALVALNVTLLTSESVRLRLLCASTHEGGVCTGVTWSNWFYLLPMACWVVRAKLYRLGGRHPPSRGARVRLDAVWWMSMAVCVASTFHHALSVEASTLYSDGVRRLMRALDWHAARVSFPAVLCSVMGATDAWEGAGGADGARLLFDALMQLLPRFALVCVYVNEVRVAASDPVGSDSIRQTVAYGSAVVFASSVVSIAASTRCCAARVRAMAAFVRSAFEFHTVARALCTLALSSSVLWAWTEQGKGPAATEESMHAAWHVATATLLTSAMNFVVDYGAISTDEGSPSPHGSKRRVASVM